MNVAMPPPKKQSAACEAAPGLTSGQGRRDSRPAVGLTQFPSNLRCSGLIAHAEHVEAVQRMVARMPNETAAAMLRLWSGCLGRMPYAVIGGRLHAAGGYVVGGLARDWEQARALFSFAMLRFGEVAEAQGEDFSSAWLMCIDPERTREIQMMIALAQETGGNA